jgi:hypothetical protein
MTDDSNASPAQIAAAKLAELVARRKAAASGRPGAQPSQRQADLAAAARSAAKSKPAMRR